MMSLPRTGLLLALLVVLTACTVAQMEKATTEEEVFTKPRPEFPGSEASKGSEGWVLVSYRAQRSGLVSDLGVTDSSGSDAFEKAALKAVQDWRYAPGEEREMNALLNFVYDHRVIQVSHRFVIQNASVHELIDNGDLEAAQAMLAEIRSHKDFTTFELAYSYLLEGRIAGERGDRAGQLYYFRRAMLNDGRWLARDNYLVCLRAAVILAIQTRDFASAVRDYELLTETRVGKKLASDLDGPIEEIRAQFAGDQFDTQPYMVADNSITVKREWPRHSSFQDRWPSQKKISMGNWPKSTAPAKKK
jgi:TonB family protein